MNPFAALDRERRWVAWRNEQRGNKLTKVPYGNGGRAKADDPATWLTREEASATAQRIVNGSGGGVGIQLGDLGADTFLAGLDLDSCLKAGTLADWAARILDVVDSYAETSPSGGGVKVFFYVGRQDVRPFLDRIGALSDGWGCRRGIPGEDSRDHGPGIEVYLNARYFAVTANRWPAAPEALRLIEAETLDALAVLIPPPSDPAGGKRSSGGDTSRSAVAFRTGAALRRSGASFEEMVATLRADPETAEWCREKGEANGGRELKRIWNRAAPATAWLAHADCDRHGIPRPTLLNVALGLRRSPRLSGTLAYDDMLCAGITPKEEE
jgi:putative DNA primase/helicase